MRKSQNFRTNYVKGQPEPQRTSSYNRNRNSTVHYEDAQVVAENIYEGRKVSERTGKSRLVGINEKETVIKEERILEGETRMVGERELERKRQTNVRRESKMTR